MNSIQSVLLIGLFTLITSCKSKKETITSTNQQVFYVGTYMASRIPDSNSEGIYKYALNQDGTMDSIGLAVKTENPSFLTKSLDHKYIIGTNSHNNGSITSFKIEKNGLSNINQVNTGDNPCYVTAGNNNYVLTANYNSGTYNLHQIKENGQLSSTLDTQKSIFSTPSDHPRQDAPHAHSCYFEPNSDNIITIDLGTNKLIFQHINQEKSIIENNKFYELEMPKNSGPRILTFHPKKPWIYVLNELNSTISFIKKNTQNNTYNIIETIETLKPIEKTGNTAAHITISDDGKYIYMSNRGHDSIGVFKVLSSGKLELIQTIGTHIKHPRHFTLSPDNNFLLVANRDTNTITSYMRNKTSGEITFVSKINAPKPVCLLF